MLAGGTVAFTSLAEAQNYAAVQGDTIVLTGGSYDAVADVEGKQITYQIDGNISANSIAVSSITVNLAGENFDSSKAAITYTGNPYDEDGNLILDYGFVNVTGGTSNAGGYISGYNLYVRNDVFYNDNSDAAIPESGATVTVDIGGATFNAVYGTNLFSYDASDNTSIWAFSNTTAKDGVAVYTGNQAYDIVSGSNGQKTANGNIFLNGATVTGGYFYFFRNGDCNHFDAAVYNSTINTTSYLSYVKNNYAPIYLVITNSTLDALKLGGSTMIFHSTVNITVTDSTIAGVAGGSGAKCEFLSDVNYKFFNSKITEEINTYIGNSAVGHCNLIDGNVNYYFENSEVSSTVYGGLKVADQNSDKVPIASSYEITGDVNITVKGGSVTNIYGSSKRDGKCTGYNIGGSVNISVDGGTVKELYANRGADVAGDVTVNLSNGAKITTLTGNEGYGDTDNVTGNVVLNISGTGSTVTNLSEFDIISIDANSVLTVSGTFSHTGNIVINGSAVSDFRKVLDAADATTYTKITANGEKTGYFVSSGDIFAYSTAANSQSKVYLNKEYTGTTGTAFADGIYCNVNAFSNIADALGALSSSGTLVVESDVTIDDWNGITNVIVKNGATITTDKWSDAISLTVDLTGVAESAKIIDWTGGTAFDYGRVNIIGGTNAGGYIDGRDLYVRNEVYYNNNTIATDLTTGSKVWVDIGGATFNAVYGTNLFNYGSPQNSDDKNLMNVGANVQSKGGIAVYTGNYDLTLSGKNSTFSPVGNVVYNGATFKANSNGMLFLVRGIKNIQNFDCAVNGVKITGTGEFRLAHDCTFDTVMKVTIADSEAGAIRIGGSNMTFNNGIDITLINSKATYLSGTTAAITDITRDVRYTVQGSEITTTVDSYLQANSANENKGHKIDGNVIYYFDSSTVGNVYGGLRVADAVSNSYTITGNVTISTKNSNITGIYGSDVRNAKCTGYTVGGTITVTMDGGTVTNLYANRGADVAGDVTVNLSNGADVTTLVGNEGYGDTDNVTGNVILNISGTANSVINLYNFDTVNLNAGASLTVTGTISEIGMINAAAGATLTANELNWSQINASEGAVLNVAKLNFDFTEAQTISGVTVQSNLFAVDGNAASVDLTVSGSTTGAVLGGGSNSDSKIGTIGENDKFTKGTIALTLTNSEVGTVYGGGYSSETGDITLTISDTVCTKMVYGGNVTNSGSGGSLSKLGNITLDIDGGIFKSQVVGGSRVVASSSELNVDVESYAETVTLNVTGGTFADSIFGAGYALGNNSSVAELSVDGVVMTLNNLTVNSNGKASHGIYAGGLAARGAQITVESVSNAGAAVNITVESGSYTSIYGGGWAESKATVTVNGGVAIAVSGGSIANLYGGGNNDTSGAKTYIEGDVLITVSGGTIDNIHAGAKYGTSRVNGNSTVQIAGTATISNIYGWTENTNADSVKYDQILDVDAALSCNSISHFDIIDIAAEKSITLVDDNAETTLSFDFTGVDLVLGEYTGDADWTVMTAEQLTNLAGADSVKFGDVNASWNENGYWATETHSLKVTEDNKLVFGKLA